MEAASLCCDEEAGPVDGLASAVCGDSPLAEAPLPSDDAHAPGSEAQAPDPLAPFRGTEAEAPAPGGEAAARTVSKALRG